jgi:hypothetical protein
MKRSRSTQPSATIMMNANLIGPVRPELCTP